MKGARRPSATLFQLQRSTATSLAAAPSSARSAALSWSSSWSLSARSIGSPVANVVSVRWPLGVGLLQPGRDLGQARVPGDERRDAGGCGLRGHHPERLGEDRGHDDDVRERQQVDEVPVLERAREQRVPRRELLEVPAVVAEPDDQGARRAPVQRLDQEVDALVVEQLAEVEDGRQLALEEVLEAACVALVREALVSVPGVRGVVPRLREQRGERLGAALRPELVDVDSRRDLVHALDVADDLLEHGADVRRADEDRVRAAERLLRLGGQLVVAANRVLELRAVRLDGEGPAGRGGDGCARQDVVRKDDVGREVFFERARVGVHVARALDRRQVLQQPRLEPVVAVEDEDGEQPVGQLGPHDLGAVEVEPLRVRVLAEDDDLVPGPLPLPRDGPRVDVRPCPLEQVPVPEQDAHAGA